MTTRREYHYVGDRDLLATLPDTSNRISVSSAEPVIIWMAGQQEEPDGTVIATFIVDTAGQLWINDRRSEHVLCAHGENVLSAGEITFEADGEDVEVIAITNQSTGYCPEPDSWWAVEVALRKAGIPHPPDFTTRYIFRRCEKCGSKNIVKDDWFICGVCDSPLSTDWNFG